MRDKPLDCEIRWMLNKDMSQVVSIEADSFEFPWMEEEFIRCLRQRNCIGLVAECEGWVAGYMIYQLDRTRIRLLNIAVAEEYHRRGIGSQMVANLIGNLSPKRRTKIILKVTETNLGAQLFFRKLGFRAARILHDQYDDTPEDVYGMRYRLEAPVKRVAILQDAKEPE